MAGKDYWLAHATADLFDHAYFLVPQKHPQYKVFKTFLNTLNCNCVEIDPTQHDSLMASISHVPYLSAVSLVLSATKSE